MKNLIKKIPVLSSIARRAYYAFIVPFKSFTSSEEYWKKRYLSGGTSGPGSYNQLAEFKAEILNNFVSDHQVEKVIEFGCGDGNQLKLSKYPTYIGFDISPEAIALCKNTFADENTKSFKLVAEYTNETAPLTVSLDVIYHLLEDKVFIDYMERLFVASTKYVIIYSSNKDEPARFHVRHRKFSKWIEKNKPNWKQIQKVPNKFPYAGENENEKSFADLYIYEKV